MAGSRSLGTIVDRKQDHTTTGILRNPTVRKEHDP
jgi:hypothetical protein